ncbi:MAG: hypothetical protein A2133_07155 [Actinobacteria bacterium RBG_16_64_13]|nr:MAG: hypothetical protein A2133_07155 [Actinobacteria bacterium RBG_16_64_13]
MCLNLAFRGGAYPPSEWLASVIGLAALALVVILSAPPVHVGRLQKVLLGLFAAQAVWTAASLFWATSLSNTWEETNRTLFYAVTIALVFAAVRWTGSKGMRVLTALVIGTVVIVGLVIVIRLSTMADPTRFFAHSRLQYPISYFNALAALLMIGFWLALGTASGIDGAWRAAGGESRRHVLLLAMQPLLLALSVFLFQLALLPQSRGAFWTFFLALPFFVIFSPNRFRALVHLAIVALPMALFWSTINDVYSSFNDRIPLETALGSAFRAMGYSVLIVAAAWAASWLVERVIGPLSRRLAVLIGVVLVVLAAGGVIGGLVYADVRSGGLDEYLSEQWTELTSDRGTGAAGDTRFTELALNGRVQQWKVAAQAFEDNPVLGVGAQNYEFYYYQHRVTLTDVKQPHSQPMQLLAELGLPGLLLWLAFFFVAVVRTAMLRFRSDDRMTKAVLAAGLTAVISWFIHSSADWLWQMAATSLPAMMLLGGLVGAGPAASPAKPSFASRRHLTRPVLAFLALAVIVSAALPYLSLRYSSLASGSPDLKTMTTRAQTAASIDPTATLPFVVRANAHWLAAVQAPEGSMERVAQFMQAAESWAAATEREPGGWLYHYKSAEMLLAARDASFAAGVSSSEELLNLARTYLDKARGLNPLAPQIAALEQGLQDDALD